MPVVHAPGARIWINEQGSGIPLVLVHGGTGTADHDWAEILPELRTRYRVITMDIRGHGRSLDPDVQLGIDRFGLDVTHVMRTLGIPRAVLVGFSVGANSLVKLLARRPGLGLGLVTIGASVAGDPSRVAHILSGPWPEDLTGLHHEVGDGPDYWRRLRVALAHDWAKNLALTDDQLQRISCPTLICHGDRDRVAPLDQALHLHRVIKGSQLLVAPGSSHQVQLDRPEILLDALIPFLDRLESRRLARIA